MLSSKTLSKLGLTLCVTSLIFQLLGFSCPGWVVLSIDLAVISVSTSLVGFGELLTQSAVWFGNVCVSGTGETETCSFVDGHDAWQLGFKLNSVLYGLRGINWLGAQIELTVALAMCVLAISSVVISMCQLKMTDAKDRILYSVAAALILVSGALVFPPVISIGLAVEDTKTAISGSAVQDMITVKAPWALILSAVGIVFAFVTSFVFTLAAFQVKHEQDSSSIFPSPVYLPPAILKIGNFPANVSMSDRIGHIPPSFNTFGDVQPPAIGSRDDEPLAFVNKAMTREHTTFEPYVLYPTLDGRASDGLMCPMADVTPQNSQPPPYHHYTGHNDVDRLSSRGSISLSVNGGNGGNTSVATSDDERNSAQNSPKLAGNAKTSGRISPSPRSGRISPSPSSSQNSMKLSSNAKTSGRISPSVRSPQSKHITLTKVHEDQLTTSANVSVTKPPNNKGVSNGTRSTTTNSAKNKRPTKFGSPAVDNHKHQPVVSSDSKTKTIKMQKLTEEQLTGSSSNANSLQFLSPYGHVSEKNKSDGGYHSNKPSKPSRSQKMNDKAHSVTLNNSSPNLPRLELPDVEEHNGDTGANNCSPTLPRLELPDVEEQHSNTGANNSVNRETNSNNSSPNTLRKTMNSPQLSVDSMINSGAYAPASSD